MNKQEIISDLKDALVLDRYLHEYLADNAEEIFELSQDVHLMTKYECFMQGYICALLQLLIDTEEE